MRNYPITMSVNDAARELSVGRTTVYKMLNNGTLFKIKIGRATRVVTDSILALVKKEG